MRTCLVFLFCLISSTLYSQGISDTVTTAPDELCRGFEEKEFRFYPGGKMTIKSEVPGSIRIVGWKKGAVRVEAEKLGTAVSRDCVESMSERYKLRVRYNQTMAKIEVTGTPEPGETVECNLVIYVPKDKTDFQAGLLRGDISVEAINGWIEVTTGEGSLSASSMAGYFSGNTPKGDIRVEMSGKRWRGLEFGAVTHDGSIDLSLPADYSATLQIETLNGNISVDYPEQIIEGESVPLNIGIRDEAQALSAEIGSGGAPVKLLSHSGDIRFSAQK